MIRRTCRPGVTLMEAIVAILIMAVGLLSLLALFPVGAMQMAQAFKDERAAQLAANADHTFRLYWKNAWMDPNTGTMRAELGPPGADTVFFREPWLQWLDQPQPPGATPIPPNATTPSYALYMDPIGWSTQGANQASVAGLPPNTLLGFVPRGTMNGLQTGPPIMRIRMCSLLDDITFGRDGAPDMSNGAVDRAGKYNCAWLFQRPRNSVRGEVNLHVVVYQSRAPADVAAKEVPYPLPGGTATTIIPGTSSVTIDTTTQGRPPLRKGGWILITGTPAVGTPPTPLPIAEFYRVVGFADAGNLLRIDLQTPIRNSAGVAVGGSYSGTVIVLDNVAEVFDRGTISATAPPAP